MKTHVYYFFWTQTLLFISFKHSWTIQQSTINNRLGMGRTETPLELVSIDFRGGNCAVIGLSYSVPFSTEVKERI
jgi:hypothetical protein